MNLDLVVNPGKSKYRIFTKRRTVDLNKFTLITEDGSPLERVSCYKYLGIWLDDKLSLNLHVAQLLKKLKPLLAFFYKNNSCLPQHCRRQIVHATFLSILNYGDII